MINSSTESFPKFMIDDSVMGSRVALLASSGKNLLGAISGSLHSTFQYPSTSLPAQSHLECPFLQRQLQGKQSGFCYLSLSFFHCHSGGGVSRQKASRDCKPEGLENWSPYFYAVQW